VDASGLDMKERRKEVMSRDVYFITRSGEEVERSEEEVY